MPGGDRLPSSFRDPSGHLFVHNGTIFRQINNSYRLHYDRLIDSGLYDTLVDRGMLVAHSHTEDDFADEYLAYKVIRPDVIPFISYPYEWCFSQLKDAALLTLEIHKLSIEHGMALKDANAYNIQFVEGKPILIDTLSFETYREGEPWVAYRQFCQHFLAPLALMAHRDVRLSELLRTNIDGVPLDLASRLLPVRTRFNFGLLTHIHLHANAQRRYAGVSVKPRRKISRTAYLGLLEGLFSTTRKLKWRLPKTEWSNYYSDTNYTDDALKQKANFVGAYIDSISPRMAWDLGANTGEFSRLAAERGVITVAFDVDPVAVERNYQAVKTNRGPSLLPLILDLTNPSPAIGWNNNERMSLLQRGPVDLVMALALIHHLAISNNVPLEVLASFFAGVGRDLIVEFVPKEDSQVQRLLATREDVFEEYHQAGFEQRFGERFHILSSKPIDDSERTLYHMRRRD
ncbi:MAG: class I SAM-dependent methyltransferase [bacterium]|nr:class I SAM-dependent methyltransferase [bacterium]